MCLTVQYQMCSSIDLLLLFMYEFLKGRYSCLKNVFLVLLIVMLGFASYYTSIRSEMPEVAPLVLLKLVLLHITLEVHSNLADLCVTLEKQWPPPCCKASAGRHGAIICGCYGEKGHRARCCPEARTRAASKRAESSPVR